MTTPKKVTTPKPTEGKAADRKPKQPESPLSLDVTEATESLLREVYQTREVKPRERNAAQKQADALVQRAYEQWVKNGSPKERPAAVPGVPVVITVPEAHEDELRRRLVRSAEHLGYGYRFGPQTKVNGNAIVIFAALDKSEYKPRKK